MHSIHAYLNFKGNCEQAFTFYKSVFGGEFAHLARFGEMPESEHFQVSESDKQKIMHVRLPIGNSVLMGSDTDERWAPFHVQGNNFSISVYADSQSEADRIFHALAEGGIASMPMNQTFWGDYFGMLTDQFGIQWMISFPVQPPTS